MNPAPRPPLRPGVTGRRLNNYWWGDHGTPCATVREMYVLLQKHGLHPKAWRTLVSVVAGEVDKYRHISTQEKLSLFLLGRSFANQQNWRLDEPT